MHFHLPRPLHGWREFIGEVGIIVIGVLIALSAEQLVEIRHWRHEVRQARSSLHHEIEHNDLVSGLRASADACIDHRLDAIEQIMEEAASHKPVSPVSNLRPPINFALNDSNWNAHRASQTITHFDDNELNLLGSYYIQVANLVYFIHLEDDAWSDLSILNGDPARLGPEDFANLRRSLERARFYNRMIATLSREELSRSEQLGIAPASPNGGRLLQTICAKWPRLPLHAHLS